MRVISVELTYSGKMQGSFWASIAVIFVQWRAYCHISYTFRPFNIQTLKNFETVHLSNFRPSTWILLDRLFLLLKIFGPSTPAPFDRPFWQIWTAHFHTSGLSTSIISNFETVHFGALRPSNFIFEHFEIDWYLKNRNYDEINDFNEFYYVVTVVINTIFE